MDEFIQGDLHAGLSDIVLEPDEFGLGEGVTISKTYAHLMAHFVMAFKPAAPGSPRPGPWKAARGGAGLTADIAADLHIPGQLGQRFRLAQTITFLLRFGINPATVLSAVANHPFNDLAQAKDPVIVPCEVFPRYCPFTTDAPIATADSLAWVREHWRSTDSLMQGSTEFALAVDAVSTGQFIHHSGLLLISLWGALEALFSPSTTELKFRVSALIAAYLESPGQERLELQKRVAKLYDKRSGAAHGKPTHAMDDVVETYNLLRRVIWSIIEHRAVPTRDDLERYLFGAALPNP